MCIDMSDPTAAPPDPDSLDVDLGRPPQPDDEQPNAAIDDDADRARNDPDGVGRIAEAHDAETEARTEAGTS
jgi:hypothetical protein